MLDSTLKTTAHFRLTVFLATLCLFPVENPALAQSATTSTTHQTTVNIWVATPGVYGIPFESIANVTSQDPGTLQDRLELSFRGKAVPFWLEDRDQNQQFGKGDRLVFAASLDQLWAPHDGDSPLAALQLKVGSVDAGNTQDSGDLDSALPSSAPKTYAVARRHLRFEQDRIRVPVTSDFLEVQPLEELGSLWFDAVISENSSAAHSVGLGSLADRARSAPLDLELKVRMLGGSSPEVPEGETHHHVDAHLNGHKVVQTRWNGRRLHSLDGDAIPSDFLEDAETATNPLKLTVPSRDPSDSGDPIIDLVYIDRIDVSYRVEHGAVHASAPLQVEPSDQSRC